MANSAATLRFADARFDLVRPGLALYGYSAVAGGGLRGPAAGACRSSRASWRCASCRPASASRYGGLWQAHGAVAHRDGADRLRRRLHAAHDRARPRCSSAACAARWSAPSPWTCAWSTSPPCRRPSSATRWCCSARRARERIGADELAAWARHHLVGDLLRHLQARAARLRRGALVMAGTPGGLMSGPDAAEPPSGPRSTWDRIVSVNDKLWAVPTGLVEQVGTHVMLFGSVGALAVQAAVPRRRARRGDGLHRRAVAADRVDDRPLRRHGLRAAADLGAAAVRHRGLRRRHARPRASRASCRRCSRRSSSPRAPAPAWPPSSARCASPSRSTRSRRWRSTRCSTWSRRA